MYLNEALLSQAGPGELKEIRFQFHDNETLKIEEGHAIIKIHQVAFNCGININQIDIFIMTDAVQLQMLYANSNQTYLNL